MICHWLNSNKIKLNVEKTEIILFRHPTKKVDYDLKIKLQGKRLRFSRSTRYLGIEIDQNLDWKQQQNKLAKKALSSSRNSNTDMLSAVTVTR